MQAFEALGGVPIEILYDRMKTAVTREDDQGHIIYNRSLLALAGHYRFVPRACRPYRAKTKGNQTASHRQNVVTTSGFATKPTPNVTSGSPPLVSRARCSS